MFAHLFAGKRFHSAIEVFGEVGKEIAAFRGTRRIGGLGNLSLPRGGSCTVLIFRVFPQELVHFLAHAETCPMKPNPNRSLLKREDLRNLLGGQLFHIVEHENNAQGWRDAQNSLVEQMVLLGGEEIAFRSHRGILKQSS
jgi:hypothetical protein